MKIEDAIRMCFAFGLKQSEIRYVLETELNFIISKRTFKRILQRNNLYRHKYPSDIVKVAEFISENIDGSGRRLGYRLMQVKCILFGYNISRENTRLLLKLLDPAGVELRKRNRLVRRRYHSVGPNTTWHLDSYDKLKPYGIAISGCIDGFSRYFIWLEANYTAIDTKIISGYFIKSVDSLGGCPQYMRCDRGTENGNVGDMFRFFQEMRYDTREEAKSRFKYGRSTANQRIECWWSFLRKRHMEFWIHMFHDMKENGQFNGYQSEKELIRFIFMDLIQSELDDMVLLWNTHYLRKNRYYQAAYGRPIAMYSLPGLYHTRDFVCRLDAGYIEICKEECSFKCGIPCDRDVYDFCTEVMHLHGLEMATNAETGRDLYLFLRRELMGVLE